MKYRMKDDPDHVVEAFQWTGGPDQTEDPVWIVDAMRAGRFVIEDGVGWIVTGEQMRERVNRYDFIVLDGEMLLSQSFQLFMKSFLTMDGDSLINIRIDSSREDVVGPYRVFLGAKHVSPFIG